MPRKTKCKPEEIKLIPNSLNFTLSLGGAHDHIDMWLKSPDGEVSRGFQVYLDEDKELRKLFNIIRGIIPSIERRYITRIYNKHLITEEEFHKYVKNIRTESKIDQGPTVHLGRPPKTNAPITSKKKPGRLNKCLEDKTISMRQKINTFDHSLMNLKTYTISEIIIMYVSHLRELDQSLKNCVKEIGPKRSRQSKSTKPTKKN